MGNASDVRAGLAARGQVIDKSDEVTLVELLGVLFRRRKMVTAIFSLCLLFGGVVIFFLPSKYEFSTTLGIASNIEKGATSLIESPLNIRAKILSKYAPQAIEESALRGDGLAASISVKTSQVNGEVSLSSLGLVSDAEKIRALHRRIADMVIERHNALTEPKMLALEKKRDLLRELVMYESERIEGLRGREHALTDYLKSLEIKRAGLHARIMGLDKKAQQISSNVAQSDFELKVLIGLEAGKYEWSLARLNELFYVTIPQNIIQNERLLLDSLKANQEYRVAIDDIESLVATWQPTQVRAAAEISMAPAEPKKVLLMVVLVFIGLVAAVFCAFFYEFIIRARSWRETHGA